MSEVDQTAKNDAPQSSSFWRFLAYFGPTLLLLLVRPSGLTFFIACCGFYMGLTASARRNGRQQTKLQNERQKANSQDRQLAPVHVTGGELVKQLAEMRGACEALDALPVFDAEDAAVEKAWTKRDVEQLDVILKEGDALTTTSWQKGIALFNSAISSVDKARSKLIYLLENSERLLATFNIDYEQVEVNASKSLHGYSAPLVRKAFLTEKLDYGQGVGSALGKVATGNVPWQVAVPVLVGMAAWSLINRSKALRQMKELQGKLALNAEFAKKDFAQFRTLLQTRLIPQMEALTALTDGLERSIADAEAVPASARQGSQDQAFRLATALVEGKRFLAMSAGD